ncbi:hypothetical protein [Lysinibacillus capsici]|uniref:hypothetical protein n=1 Tax=Lysinibacillus capsici TaxID=2115968 RepID=UPI0034E5BBC6
MKKIEVAIDHEKLKIILKRTTRLTKTKNMIHAFKERYKDFFEIKDLTQLFDISLKSAMKITKDIKKYDLIFMESDSTQFNSNIKYLIHKKDIKKYLMQDCNVEYIERILEVGTYPADWMIDYFFRKSIGVKKEANTVFEIKKNLKEVSKIIDSLLSGYIQLYSRDYVQAKLYKNREKDKNYSTSTIDRLLKCVTVLKITWKNMKMPTVKIIDANEQFNYYRYLINETSKRKTVKLIGFEEIGELPVKTEKFPMISLDRAIQLGLKNSKGKLITAIDVTAFEQAQSNSNIFIGLIDLNQTNERIRLVTLGLNYELPKEK